MTTERRPHRRSPAASITAKLTRLALLLVVGACNGSSQGAEQARPAAGAAGNAAPAPVAGGRFSAALEGKGCELLTAAVVSRLSGVPETDLAASAPAGWCRYKGGGVTATLMGLEVGTDAQRSAARFDSTYRDKSGDQVAQDMETIQAQVDRQRAQGEIDERTAQGAKAVGDAVGGVMAGGFQYEEIAGPWDRARLDRSEHVVKVGAREIKSYANKIHVLVSNLVFTVEYQTREPGLHRDELVEIAKGVVENLPQ